MTVWQKVATGSSLDEEGVHSWLTKYDIRACELEDKVRYTGKKLECSMDCDRCLSRYLSIELDRQVFEQLSLF